MGVNPKPVLGRVGVVGDVHAEDELLAAVLDEFEKHALDAILCVGDIADGEGDLNRACALLAERHVITVTGNHDRWLLGDENRNEPGMSQLRNVTPEARAFLEALPTKLAFDTPRGRLLLCHGVGDDDMAGVKRDHLRFDLERNDALRRVLAGPRYDFMVAGHTHQHMVRRVRHLTIINAGTLHRHYEQKACLLDFRAGLATFLEPTGGAFTPVEELPFPEADEWSRT